MKRIVFGSPDAIRLVVLSMPTIVQRLRFGLLLLALCAAPSIAAEIEPDRPELTESAKLVPRGATQLEFGPAFSRERQAGQAPEKTFQVEADLRIGLARNVELNLGWDPLVRVRGSDDDTGVGDVTLGVRYRFVEGFEDALWPPHLGVKVFAKLPAAEPPIGTGRPDFGVLLLASLELPHEFELEINLGAAAVGQRRTNGYLAQAIATTALSREIAPSLLGFLEMLYNSPDERGGRGMLAVNVGLIYRLTRRLAIDAAIQTSLAGQGPDYVVRTGLSVLWR